MPRIFHDLDLVIDNPTVGVGGKRTRVGVNEAERDYRSFGRAVYTERAARRKNPKRAADELRWHGSAPTCKHAKRRKRAAGALCRFDQLLQERRCPDRDVDFVAIDQGDCLVGVPAVHQYGARPMIKRHLGAIGISGDMGDGRWHQHDIACVQVPERYTGIDGAGQRLVAVQHALGSPRRTRRVDVQLHRIRLHLWPGDRSAAGAITSLS